jgi:hypothetical protein
MKKNWNPPGLFEQISAVENRYNKTATKIDEEDLIAVILDVSPV